MFSCVSDEERDEWMSAIKGAVPLSPLVADPDPLAQFGSTVHHSFMVTSSYIYVLVINYNHGLQNFNLLFLV